MYGYPVNEWIQEDSEVDDEPEQVDGRQNRLTDPFLYLICPDEPEGMQRDVEEGVQRDVEEGVQGDDEDIDVASDESLNVEEEGHAEEGQEEGEEAKREIVYPMHDPNENWRKMKPILGMRFENPEQLKYCLSNYAVANGYALYYERNEQRSILCRCGKKTKGVTCPFRCWATWMSTERSFQIKSLNPEHTCSRNFTLGSIVTYHWIAKQYVKTLIENPLISLRAMAADVKEKFNINVTLGQCRRAKDKGMKDIEGNLIDHYARLWDYATEIKRSNPGSTVSLEVNTMPDGSNYFSRFYVCFKALRDGWIEGCRNVIGLDGGFLKGFCTGELISAIGRDGNNQMFPIAWAVVCVENKDNWTWFLNLLVDDLELEDGYGLTVMSDQHKGLMEAVKEKIPRAEHRQCARHIYANFKK